jgi:hypothetical protein
MTLVNIKSEIQEISHTINNYVTLYSRIINNHNLKLFSNIILNINNFLNRETGKKELSNFDIVCFESLCNLKVNSKCFLQFAFSVYQSQLVKNSEFKKSSMNIFDRQEINILESLLENNNSLSNLFLQVEKIQKDFEESKETIHHIIINKQILSKFTDFTIEIQNKLKLLDFSLQDEQEKRNEFLEFFHYSLKDEAGKFSLITSIFKNIMLIAKKSILCLKEYSTRQLQTISKENPEKKENKILQKGVESIKNSKSVAEFKKPSLGAIGQSSAHSNLLSLKYKLK